ncbi:MAG: hypothetical protein AAFM91_07765 [Pseudomonadota bacterium]
MYRVDGNDRVIELDALPQSSVGAPIPYVFASELFTYVAYYAQETDPNWDGSTVRVVGPDSSDERVIVVRFDSYATYFGPPNDEAFDGHPLEQRGLTPYGFFEIANSSWIRSLEKMNSVHRNHNGEEFLRRNRHFVLSFHDSTFECVARSFEWVEDTRGSVVDAINSTVIRSRN